LQINRPFRHPTPAADLGRKVRDATSPIAGAVLYTGAVPSLKKGDTIAHIGEIEK
jgi:hypothetical protein